MCSESRGHYFLTFLYPQYLVHWGILGGLISIHSVDSGWLGGWPAGGLDGWIAGWMNGRWMDER